MGTCELSWMKACGWGPGANYCGYRSHLCPRLPRRWPYSIPGHSHKHDSLSIWSKAGGGRPDLALQSHRNCVIPRPLQLLISVKKTLILSYYMKTFLFHSMWNVIWKYILWILYENILISPIPLSSSEFLSMYLYLLFPTVHVLLCLLALSLFLKTQDIN